MPRDFKKYSKHFVNACVFCFSLVAQHFLLSSIFISSQIRGQNLINNSSFEIRTQCPNSSNQLHYAIGWSSYCSSPDYFHGCSPFGFSPPNSMWGFQQPHSGTAYASLVTYQSHSFYRELIGTTLSSPLVIGQRYYISFYVNYAWEPLSSGLASNKMGLRFLTSSYSGDNCVPISNFSHLHTDSILSDTLTWIKLSGYFVADSAYTRIAIGNFYSDVLTNTLLTGPGPAVYSMYYIDDVCVSVDTLCPQTDIGTWTRQIDLVPNETKIFLGPNPFDEYLFIPIQNSEWCQLELYTVQGEKLLTRMVYGGATISTTNISSGTYYYKLLFANGNSLHGKIFKL